MCPTDHSLPTGTLCLLSDLQHLSVCQQGSQEVLCYLACPVGSIGLYTGVSLSGRENSLLCSSMSTLRALRHEKELQSECLNTMQWSGGKVFCVLFYLPLKQNLGVSNKFAILHLGYIYRCPWMHVAHDCRLCMPARISLPLNNVHQRDSNSSQVLPSQPNWLSLWVICRLGNSGCRCLILGTYNAACPFQKYDPKIVYFPLK